MLVLHQTVTNQNDPRRFIQDSDTFLPYLQSEDIKGHQAGILQYLLLWFSPLWMEVKYSHADWCPYKWLQRVKENQDTAFSPSVKWFWLIRPHRYPPGDIFSWAKQIKTVNTLSSHLCAILPSQRNQSLHAERVGPGRTRARQHRTFAQSLVNLVFELRGKGWTDDQSPSGMNIVRPQM